MTIKEKTKCEKLYEEYKLLSRETQIIAEEYVPGKDLKVQNVNLDKLLKKEALRQELLEKCRNFLESELSPEEIFEIENG